MTTEELQSKIDELETRLKTAETEAGKVKDLEERLKKAEESGGGGSTDTSPAGALVSATQGKSWKGGVAFQGGPQHYAMASDAFKMALECKDRGDSRSFSMIFDQIFMEQRRLPGVAEKKDPKGGYNSALLIQDVFEKSKELQSKGDDRPFGLIFADVSFRNRRGKIRW